MHIEHKQRTVYKCVCLWCCLFAMCSLQSSVCMDALYPYTDLAATCLTINSTPFERRCLLPFDKFVFLKFVYISRHVICLCCLLIELAVICIRYQNGELFIICNNILLCKFEHFSLQHKYIMHVHSILYWPSIASVAAMKIIHHKVHINNLKTSHAKSCGTHVTHVTALEA